MATIGLDKLYYAKITEDSDGKLHEWEVQIREKEEE